MKLSVMLILAFCFVSLSANYVEKMPSVYTQPDGSKLSLYVTGDEYYHRVHDESGYTILQHPDTGYAVYAVPDGNSITASNYRVGTVDPNTLGIIPNLFKNGEEREKRFQEQLHKTNSANRGSPVGSFNNIVCFVRFHDQTEFPTLPAFSSYYDLFNSTTQQSLTDYYDEVSNGQLQINSHLYSNGAQAWDNYVVSKQVSHNRAYYSPYNAATNTEGYTSGDQASLREAELIGELCNKLNMSVHFSIDLDVDDDGINDALSFIFRGATDQWGDLLWPSQSEWNGDLGFINNVAIRRYVKYFEAGIGASVICHEMGHMIGFPDLYHYSDDGLIPVGQWSLMASDNAQHSTTYEKWKYGTWFTTLPTITPSSTPTTYTLTAIDQNPYACYKIASSLPNEYYMLEYRRDTGRYESGIPGSGLIIYRVLSNYNSEPTYGNSNGPPDEIYIYRPGGDFDTDGSPNSANYSSTVGRTAIHNFTNPKPWLYVNNTTQLDGNLAITDIGASGGTTISFTVHNTIVNTWDGSSSTAWDTAANWSQNMVPTTVQCVEISGGLSRYPVVSSTTPTCSNLIVKPGASLTIGAGTLKVLKDMDIYGILVMNNIAGDLYVAGDLIFQTGGSTNISVDAEIFVNSDVDFLAGSNVNMAHGSLFFTGGGMSFIRCYTASAINNLKSYKTDSFLGFAATSTAPITINGNFWTYSGTSTLGYDGKTIIKGSLYCYTGGLLTCYSGTLSFEGNSASVIVFDEPGNFINNLTINKASSSVTATGVMEIRGSFMLQAGSFVAPANLKIAGNWENLVGPAAFVEGTGSVTFAGTENQYCNNSETFYSLVLSKNNRLIIDRLLAQVSCNNYTWTAGSLEVIKGNFTANDLVQNGIYGNFYVSTLGTINLHQDSSGWIDLNGFLYNSGGTINIYGGFIAMYLAQAVDAGVTMTSGLIDIKNQGMVLMPTLHNLTWDIQGGTLAVSGSIIDYRGNWVNSGGTVKLYGANAYDLILSTGSRLYNLTIDKQPLSREPALLSVSEIVSGGRRQRIDTREEAINAGSNISIYGSLNVTHGSFNPNGHNINISNDLTVYGSIKMLGGETIDVGGDVIWQGADNVNSGIINCGGSWLFGSGSTADLSGSSVHLLAPYGCELTNNSLTAKFGNLDIEGSDEDPVCSFICAIGAALKVASALIIHETNTLNLNQNSCYAGSTDIHDTAALIVGDGGMLDISTTLLLAGTLDIGPGSVTSHGFFSFPYSGMLLIDGGSFSNDAPWIMRGRFDLLGGISVNGGNLEIAHNDVNLYAHTTRTFVNASLQMGRSFSATINGAYHPQGGTLSLTGNTDSSLEISNGNYLANLVVQKSSASATVSLANPLTISGEVQLNSGKLAAGAYKLTIGGNIYISSVLSLSPGGSIDMAANKGISVLSGGILNLFGSNTLPVEFSRSGSSGYYALHVESGGTIAADYAIFEYLNANGVYLQSGATIDPLHAFRGCTFRKGIADGTLLRIDNSQILTIAQANFPANTWGGVHNVSKTLNQGELSFITYSGTYAGAAFEQDSYNRISWNLTGIPMVESLSMNPQTGTANLILSWDYPYAYDLFRIMTCSTPDGTFTQLDTSAIKSYVVPSGNTKAFFRVIAVDY